MTKAMDMEVITITVSIKEGHKNVMLMMEPVTDTMDMEGMTITVSTMEGHKNVMIIREPVTDRANNVLTDHLQASLRAITIAAVALDTEDMLTMNNFFTTKC